MGVALSSVAVRGRSPESALEVLGWRRTGKEEEEGGSSPAVLTSLSRDWFAVLLRDVDATDGTVDLGRLSEQAEVIACFVEEHVMFSCATGWLNGRQVWSVTHDPDEGRCHLAVTGQPPPALATLTKGLDEQQAEDEEVDLFFDVPVDVAESVTSFRYTSDEKAGGGMLKYEILEPVPGGRRRGWWRSLLGRQA